MTKDFWIGIGCLIVGIYILWDTIKNWIPKNDTLVVNIKELFAAAGFIIGGILFLIGYFHW